MKEDEAAIHNFWIASIFWQNSLAACSCDVDVGLSPYDRYNMMMNAADAAAFVVSRLTNVH